MKNLPDDPDFHPLAEALQLCDNHNMIHEVCEIYDMILKSSNFTEHEKKGTYDDYADFLVKWGMLDASISLLYKKITFVDMSME